MKSSNFGTKPINDYCFSTVVQRDFDNFASLCYQCNIMKKLISQSKSFPGEKVNFLSIGTLVLALLILDACSINLLPSKDKWYMQHYIIMQDFERAAYKKLSPEAKEKFQILFWEDRWPEARMEFLRRMDHVMKIFKKENPAQPWNTDRARILLLNGSPASIEYKQTDNWGMKIVEGGKGVTGITSERDKENIQARTAEVWAYQCDEQFVYYAFTFSAPKKWKLAQGAFSGNRFLGKLEIRSREQTYAIKDIDQYTKKLENLKKAK